MTHLLIYDGGCLLCNRVVVFILQRDKREVFLFAPLEGKTAEPYLKRFPLEEYDTLIFVENYLGDNPRVFIESKAALRVLWHLMGWYRVLGALSFLPSFCFDWAYRWVAKRRYKFFPKPEKIDVESVKSRLLQ